MCIRDRQHGVPEAVGVIRGGGQTAERLVEVVGEERGVAVRHTVDGLGVGVEQQLGGVAAVSVGQVVRPVHAEPVPLPGRDGREVAMPDEGVSLG